MKSYNVVEFGQPLEAATRETPVPNGTEVVLRVRATGVCHTDLHIHEGGYDLGGGRRLSFKERGIKLPLTLGHETVGEVIATGPASKGVKVGDTRLVFPWIGCGDCTACKRGEENICAAPRSLGVFRDGGYSDHIVVPHPRYLLEIGRLSPAEAAPYACAGLTTYSALKKVANVIADQSIVIIGAGGLGLMCVTLLRALGGKGAVVVDLADAKLEAARQAGALATVNAGASDAAAQIVKHVGGAPSAVIDFVGASATAKLGTDMLAKGGKYIIVGLFGGDLNLALPLIPVRAIAIQGSYVGTLDELRELMALVQKVEPARIPITSRPLDQANQTLDDLRDGKLVGRIVLEPRA